MIFRRALIVLAVLFPGVVFGVMGQTQLVLVNRERVLARYSYGDDFIYKLKKSNHYTTAAVAGVQEFAVITFTDTIPFAAIERVSLKGQQRKTPLVADLLIKAGLAYFLIDQFNNIVVQGQKPDMEPSVWKPSLVMVASGFIIKWTHKKSQRIRFPAKLLSATYGSKFYKSIE